METRRRYWNDSSLEETTLPRYFRTPATGFNRQFSTRSRVDFPLPLGPIRDMNSPSEMEKEGMSRIDAPPSCTFRFSMEIMPSFMLTVVSLAVESR